MTDTVVQRELADGRLTLTLDRPQKHNALDGALIAQLTEHVSQAAADDDVRYIVLAGNGKSFCSGADLTWMSKVVSSGGKAESVLIDLLEAMITHPKPVIGRVHGAALGGGMGLVAACDMVVAAPRARLGLTEVRLGLVPAMIFPFLMRKVHRRDLLEAALTGERFDAERAEQLGLVNAVAEDMDAQISRWGEQLVQNGPLAMGYVKQLFQRIPQLAWADARSYTSEMIAELRVSDEAQEGMMAFLQKRKARWVP